MGFVTSDRFSFNSGRSCTPYIAEDDFQPLIPLHPPPKYWDYRDRNSSPTCDPELVDIKMFLVPFP
ncbi:hypothetical protein LEMLEM_LOCUS4488 [Lemmus lemmus]